MTVDAMPADRALQAMLDSQVAAARAVAAALPDIESAASAVAGALAAGHALSYAAAGSSGLMALADACELPGTFGIAQDRIRIFMAGGVPADGRMPGDTEDDTADAAAIAAEMAPGDVAIVVSASGTTPYACAVAEAVAARGNTVIGIANVPGSPLLRTARFPVALPTGPEIVQGSTRLGAGTAQKIALNMMSTLAGTLLGHVHDGMMVNLNPDNIKLRQRAAGIVQSVAGVGSDAAQQALTSASYDTKLAILIAAGAEPGAARALLAGNGNRIRESLAALAAASTKTHEHNQGRTT